MAEIEAVVEEERLAREGSAVEGSLFRKRKLHSVRDRVRHLPLTAVVGSKLCVFPFVLVLSS